MISWDFSGLPVLLNDSLHDIDLENDNPVICYERSLRPVAKAIEAAGLHGIGYCFACGDTISYEFLGFLGATYDFEGGLTEGRHGWCYPIICSVLSKLACLTEKVAAARSC